MKHKSAARPNWSRVPESRFAVIHLDTLEFSGYVTLIILDKVAEPKWVTIQGLDYCLADNGYAWMQQFPVGTNYAVTTQFDALGQPQQWYIDICKQHGVDEQGIPWYDDLYLDIVVAPNGDREILDADELDEALQKNVITQADYDLAWTTAKKVWELIEKKEFGLMQLCYEHRQLLLNQLAT